MALDPFHISLAEFDIESEALGSGAYSEIILATHRRDGRHYALKVVNKDKAMRHNNVKYFINERRVMLMLEHNRIVQLRWTTKDMQNIYFFYERAPHGELWETLRGFPGFVPSPGLRRAWMSQLVAAVEYIHMTHSIAHRDLKPENILLGPDFNLLLCDFGTAKIMTAAVLDGEHQQYIKAVADATQRVDQLDSMRQMSGLGPQIQGADVLSAEENRRRSILYQASRTQSFTGTPHYMSPETIRSHGTRGTAADLWALGVILFQLETGQLPFQHQSQFAVMKEVVKLHFDLDLVQDDDARDLIRQLLNPNPRTRLGVVGDDGASAQFPRRPAAVTAGTDRGQDGTSGQPTTKAGTGQNDDSDSSDDDDDDGGPDYQADNDLYLDEIDPLTKKRRPKLLSATTVSSTQLGWDAIKAHPYFSSLPEFNADLSPEMRQEAQEARDRCFDFITFYDEHGNEVMHPKRAMQAELKRKEEEETRALEAQLAEAFPHIGEDVNLGQAEAAPAPAPAPSETD